MPTADEMKAIMPEASTGVSGAITAPEEDEGEDDTVEREFLKQAMTASKQGSADGFADSMIQAIRECVQKELAKGY